MALDLTYDPSFSADSGGDLDFTYDAGVSAPKKQNKGILGDLKDTLVEGAMGAGRAISGAANVYSGNESGLVEKSKAQEAAVKPVPLQGFYDEVKNRVKPLGEDPGIIDSIKAVGGAVANKPYGAGLAVVEQLPNAAPAIGGALLGAKGGAALGAFAGPVGAAVGGIAGGIAGMFIGNSAIETGYKGIEAAQDGSVTPEEFSRVKKEGAVKGGVITAVDAATLGLSKAVTGIPGRAVESATRKALTKAGVDVADESAVLAARQSPEISAAVRAAQDSAFASANTIGKRTATGGAALGLESIGEGLGEYFGELAATGRANVADAVLEGMMSLGQSGAEVAWGIARNKEQNKANTWNVAPQPEPVITVDPVPLQQRIDAMMGIDHEVMDDKARAQYEKDLAAAFLEPVGTTNDENGLEVPFTMADYLSAQVRAEDESRARPLRQQAGQSADTRLQQIADEESAQQPDIAPVARGIAAAPVIPVVGPLSAVANAAVQSGAHQTAVMQQAAAQAAKNTPPEGKAGTPAGAQPKAAAPAQGPLTEVAGQAPNVATPAPNPATPANAAPAATTGDPFIRSRTDAQLNWLAERGKPELKAAAVAEIQQRQGNIYPNLPASNSETVPALNAADSANAPEIPNGDGVTNAPGVSLANEGDTKQAAVSKAETGPAKFDPQGLVPGTPAYNAAFEAWSNERYSNKTDESNQRQREENKQSVGIKNRWRSKIREWFSNASDGDSITDVTGQRYVVLVKTRKDGTVTKSLLAVDENGTPLPEGRAATGIGKVGERIDGLNDGGIDSDTGSEFAETSAQSFAASLGQQLETGEAKTEALANQEPVKNASPAAATVPAESVATNQEPIKNQSEQALDMVPAVNSVSQPKTDTAPEAAPANAPASTPEPDAALQNRDRGRAASVNQMQSIARNPDYMRLGPSRTPDSGAPMVFAVGNDKQRIPSTNFGASDTAVMSDGQRVPFRYAVIDANQVQPSNFADGATNPEFTSTTPGTIKALNNGRTAGVRAAHAAGSATSYTAELMTDGAHGVSQEAIRSTPNPMLVRVYDEQANTGDMAAKSQGQGLGMSASERATQDAELMTADVLDKFAPGDIASAGNRDFVRSFVGKLAANDVADLMDATGNLSQDGRRRIEAALLTSAYGKSDLVQELFESTDTDIKAIGNALKIMSGQWAAMRQAAKEGSIDPATDMTANLIEAVNIVRRSRAEGSSVAELAGQGDLMGGNYLNELSELFLRIFYKGKNYDRARGGDKVIAALQEIVTSAMNTKAEAGLFGDSFKATPKQIVESARSKIDAENQSASQSSLFGANGQATAVSQGNRSESAQKPGEVGSRPVSPGRGEETGKQAEPVDEAAEQEPKPNAKEAPSKYGIYQLADGSFAKFDRVWYRGEKTERAAMLSEMVIPGNSAPKDRLDSQSWVFAKGFSRNDFDGSPLRLTKNGEDAAVDAKKQEEAKPSEMDVLKAEMGQAIGELASILGAKQNLTPEEESRIIPVMSKIFRIAAKMGYIKFKDAANYVLDQIRQLAGADVADKISIDNLQAGYINIAKEIGGDKREAMSYDSIEDLEKANVTDKRSGANLEPDSGNTGTENGLGEEGVRAGRGGDGGTGRPGVQGSEESLRASSGSELSGPEAAAAGERGNLEIYTGATELSPGSAGNSVDSGGRDSGIEGAPIEPDATEATRQSSTSPNDLKAKQFAQVRADKSVEHKAGIAAIRAALPILTENQQDDVAKAEDRFAVPDGYGMLFTNGTGTGKTFTGLGVIKRFANAGKTNILIVAPNDKIIEDWQKSGKLLGLDLSRLDNTNDAGKGIVITTYANMGQNNALASRDWDLVVHDEAHYLAMDKDGTNTNALKNLRAISLHPDGVFQRHNMQNAADIQKLAELDADAKMQRMSDDQRMWALAEKTQADADRLRSELKAKQEAIKEEVTGRQGAKRTRALFLSATPFAYEKTVDWANGYIFDYNEGRTSEEREFRGYNVGSNSDQFMMQHFGYRMRYGKLTQPDAKVDSGLMQRQFNSWLKKKGSLSGRMLDVAADYDRRFILVDSAIGQRIDEALQWFEVKRKAQHAGVGEAGERIGAIMAKADPYASALSAVRDHIGEKFDYLSRRYLLESIKAREVVPHIREHLALGRKIVVFHDYKKGGGFNPFILDERSVKAQEAEDGTVQAAEWNKVVREFNAEFRDIINSDLFKQSSPIDMFKAEFPGVLLFNGDVPSKMRRANVAKFQDDASGPQVILVQSTAGKEGISLHDTTGKHQRVLFNLGQPTQPTTAIQQEGRIYRTGQVTDAIFRYLNTGTNWEKWAFATTIAQRASAAENLGMGEQARALKDAFISGFEESGDYRAGMENEGKGGKERDKAANDALTEYDRARAFYFGTQKKTSKTKAQEGADYFATPEPVGLKMVEWADIRPGEKVLEPSAGHGAIARWMPTTAERTAIEPSMALRPRLAMVFDGQIIDTDFESMNVVNKFDAIVMNPPFGSGGKTAVDHLAKAAAHLRDGGRIVALLPTGPAADKKFDKWMFEGETRPTKPIYTHPELGHIHENDTLTISAFGSDLKIKGPLVIDGSGSGPRFVRPKGEAKSSAVNLVALKSVTPGNRTELFRPADGIYMVADIKMPAVTFERAGTKVMTRIVVLEKQSDTTKAPNGGNQVDLSGIDDINDLFNRVEYVGLPNRPKEPVAEEVPQESPARQQKPAPAAVGDVVTVNGNEYAIEIYTTNDGKDKRGIWMEEKEAKEINPRAFKSSKMRGTPAEGKFFVDEYWLNKRKPDAVGNIAATGTISPADKAIYGMSAEGKSAAEILKFIASASRNPFNRQVAKLLLKTGIAPSITVGDGKNWKISDAKSGEAFAAAYDPKTDTVALFRPASSERHMLHELIHAASLKALSKKGLAAMQMRALFAHVEKTGKLTGMYGIRNVDEFIAEAFTNPKFQAMLKQVSAAPVGGKPSSAWDWFVRVVRGILGLKQGQDNALSQALDIGLGVMRENMALNSGDGSIKFNYALRSNAAINSPVDANRIADLRLIAAGLERPKDAVFLRVTDDGKAITTGPKGVRIPDSFIRFAETHGLNFEARRNGEGRKSNDVTTGGHITSKTEPMPTEYREAGALYYGEGNEFFDRTGKTRYALSGDKTKPKQTDSESFRKWFGSSKVVDSDGQPLVVYHGTKNDFSAFLPDSHFGTKDQADSILAEKRGKIGKRVMPVYLSVQKMKRVKDQEIAQRWADVVATAKRQGYDGLVYKNEYEGDGTADSYVVFEPTQIKSAIGNNGDFDGGNPDIRYNVADEGWSITEPSKMDDVIYALQDKQIDMKRVMQSIMKTGKQIKDNFNPYLQEELFHGRAAKGVKDFLDLELRPLLKEMNDASIDMGDFEEYLWNRHAQERNEQIAKINPEMPDGGSGIETAKARAYLAGLTAGQRKVFESLATKIQAMNRESQKVLVESGLEKQSTIDAWNGAYQNYVPLQREDVDTGHVGTGKGFSVRGSSSKRAMGSGKAVVDIISNLTMQRERNIVRAEKNRVSNALAGLAVQNPNADFWTFDKAPKERVVEEKAIYTVLDSAGKKIEEFTRMDEAYRLANKTPGASVDQSWGDRVSERVVPGFKNRDNVLLTRINGEDHYIIFNERDERAMRMATALKNLDVDNLGRVLSLVGKATRYLASINTQYNPVFGVINLIRDAQGALINLSSTPLAGEQKRVLGYTKDALVGIYKDIRAHRSGNVPSSNWAKLFEEFQKEGGQTGYRDQYANAEQRAESIKSELEQFKEGKAKQLTRGIIGWLSDYNETMENAVRLAAYKAAKEKGMSKQQAASLAKNITVNFNRKGQMATQVGALYAFFNASVQGTARMAETLFEQNDGDFKKIRLSKKGKQIIAGGVMLGAMQALLLAAAGFGDDEPPEFIRERNLIMPIGDGKYLTLAMPLGLHVIPGIGRIATEFVLSGGEDPIKKLAAFGSMFAGAFNPIGNSGFSLQTITPSVVDPFAALAENRDFTGKEIYRENRNAMSPTPGHARAKDVATVWSRFLSETINRASGGTEFKPGMFSPSPDSIDYLLAQAGGGVMREANKVAQTVGSATTGEDLPLYKIPLVGRFVGDTKGQSGESAKFYDAIKQINMHENQMKGLREERRFDEAREYAQENPAVRLIMAGNHAERSVQKLRSLKRDLIKDDADQSKVKAIDERITATMKSFNERAATAF